jgi:anthranilate synthase component 1
MQIIAALEQAPRGAYTGAFGYLDRNGDLDLNILIRTLTLHDREVSLRAGAGIVADSVAEKELDETRAKARGMLRALGADSCLCLSMVNG